MSCLILTNSPYRRANSGRRSQGLPRKISEGEHKVSRWYLSLNVMGNIFSTTNTALVHSHSPPTASVMKACVIVLAWRLRCSVAARDGRGTITRSFLEGRSPKGEQKAITDSGFAGREIGFLISNTVFCCVGLIACFVFVLTGRKPTSMAWQL